MFMVRKLSIVNMSILYKVIHGSSATLAKILEDKMTQKCIWKCKRATNSRSSSKKGQRLDELHNIMQRFTINFVKQDLIY